MESSSHVPRLRESELGHRTGVGWLPHLERHLTQVNVTLQHHSSHHARSRDTKIERDREWHSRRHSLSGRTALSHVVRVVRQEADIRVIGSFDLEMQSVVNTEISVLKDHDACERTANLTWKRRTCVVFPTGADDIQQPSIVLR